MTEEKPIRDRDELHQLSQYLLGYARYDLDEGASDSSRYLLDDLEMCLHHVREGNWEDPEAIKTMSQHALSWLEDMVLAGTEAYAGGAHDEESVADGIVNYFTNHAEGIDVYTECPNCVGGIVGPRGCMDCNDPTGEYARADEQAEQLKDMKNW